MSGASSVRRRARLMYDGFTLSAAASSPTVAYSPYSRIFCQRWALGSALTSALRVRVLVGGVAIEPSGATTSFRPPRRRQ